MYIYAVYYLHCWNQCLCTYLKLRILLEDKCLFLVQLLKWALCFDCTDISLSTNEWGRLTEGHLELECPRRDVAGCLTYQLSSPEGKKMKPFNGWIFLLSKVMTCLPLVSWNEWKKKKRSKNILWREQTVHGLQFIALLLPTYFVNWAYCQSGCFPQFLSMQFNA